MEKSKVEKDVVTVSAQGSLERCQVVERSTNKCFVLELHQASVCFGSNQMCTPSTIQVMIDR